MKNRLLTAGVIAAMMLPAAASAATGRGELARDRQDIRQEQRDVRQAQHRGTPHRVREERRELRGARQEYREDRRDFRADRHYGNYRAPFRYRAFTPGVRMSTGYYAKPYRVQWNSHWRVPRAGRHLSYVRHYGDLLLVNARSGIVVKVYRGFFW